MLNAAVGGAAYAGSTRTVGYVGPGARLGLRRWLTRYLIGTGLVEYGLLTWVNKLDGNGLPSDSGDRWRMSHSIAVLSRLELASFKDRSRLLSLPKFSLYPVAGAVLMFGGGPQTGAGYRVGVGFQVATKFWSFALDVTFQQLFFDELSMKTSQISLGILSF